MYHAQIKLNQIASPSNQDWTDHERAFMARLEIPSVSLSSLVVDGGITAAYVTPED